MSKEPSSFLYFQSVVQFCIPVYEDGTTGKPEIKKRWTQPFKGAQHLTKKKVQKKVTELISNEVEEEWE